MRSGAHFFLWLLPVWAQLACSADAKHRSPALLTPSQASTAESSGPPPVVKRITLPAAGLDPDAIDRSVDACDDLYQHACGGWVKTFQVPPEKRTYEKVFTARDDAIEAQLREILEGMPLSGASKGEQQLSDFYRACMDERTIDARSTKPIDKYLHQVKSATTREELATAMGEIHPLIDAFFSFGTRPHPANSSLRIAYIGEGGVHGLVTSDYYLSVDPEKVALRHAYEAHVVQMLEDARIPPNEAKEMAEHTMKLQTALAVAMKPPENAKPRGKPVMFALADLEREAPAFPWRAFFHSVGLVDASHIRIDNLQFVKDMAATFGAATLAELSDYLYWRTLSDLSYVLGEPFASERFKMNQATWGKAEAEPRWKVCVRATRTSLRDVLTREYVARYLPEERRIAFRAMFRDFVSAFGDRLDELDWMDEATRAKAKEKLEKMTLMVGYPDQLADHDFPIGIDTYGENVLVPLLAVARKRFASVGSQIDRGEWFRNPLVINAFVDNWVNAAIFPAAILQPPVFDPNATIPVRYGAIGFHLGHEMTHGFDPDGSQFDGAGNVVNWWTPETRARFEEKTRCVGAQYGAYEPIPGVHVDGKKSLGENVADLGGVKLAFRAYQNARKGATEVTVADGYTEDQQFFMSFAQEFCVKFGDQDLRRFLETNPHAPHWLRVNGVVRNLPEFSQAFGCKAPAASACEVW